MKKDQTPVGKRLSSFRKFMKKQGLDAYIVYDSDPHQNEKPPAHWREREWLSGFTGSAGVLVVAPDEAGLWTDGRYMVQAKAELSNTGIEVHQVGIENAKDIPSFLADNLQPGSRIGFNGDNVSLKQLRTLSKELEKKNIRIEADPNPVTDLWTERPDLPQGPIEIHPFQYAGKTVGDKLSSLREEMGKNGLDFYLISQLDSIAWLFNIRGSDIEYTPVALAYALIAKEEAVLYLNSPSLDSELRGRFEENKVRTEDYLQVHSDLKNIGKGQRIGFDPKVTSYSISNSISEHSVKQELACPVKRMKAIKNETEISNLKQVMIRDGVAMCRFLFWLENKLDTGITELDAAEHLRGLREEQPDMRFLSFETITAYGENAALPHYHADPVNCRKLKREGLYLVDSGGNYRGGTTDITRTIPLGKTSEEMKRDFTLVLRGLINLSKVRFLAGSQGSNLDVLARLPLWEHGSDYKHGTGHGVGSYLNVHEGPCGLSLKDAHKLVPGMILTIEPGCYREGKYGIRHENMVVVVPRESIDGNTFYGFETLTLCPIDATALLPDYFTSEEREWLNAYHQKVFDTLSPHLEEDVRQWLKTKTAPVPAPNCFF